ncbi:MAG: hypothetical protein ACOC34_05830 [Thermotogota bacterium]
MGIVILDGSGGFDAASLCIAGYFTNKKYLAYKKQAFTKSEYAPLQEVYVNPKSKMPPNVKTQK